MPRTKAAIILAAGQGKRMKSDLPKVLHRIHGRPMVQILLTTLSALDFDDLVVVIGHRGQMVQEVLQEYPVRFVWQRQQLGTAHAVQMTAPLLANREGLTLVVNGDVPFLTRRSLEKLQDVHVRNQAAATCLSATFDDPTGYGRIVRVGQADLLSEIVEEKDASDEIRAIREINSGTFCFDTQHLFSVLADVGCDNAQQEYYLTDTVKILHDKGLRVAVVAADNPDEVRGVNSLEQLRRLEKKFPRT